MAERLSLSERVRRIATVAGLIQRHYELWRFFGNRTDEKTVSVFGDYTSLVQLETHSHQSLCLLHFSALFAKSADADTLAKVVDDVGKMAGTGALVAACRERLPERNESLNNIIAIRNNAIAHRNLSMTNDQSYSNFPVPDSEVQKLIADIIWIATALADHCKVNPPSTIASYALENAHRLFRLPSNDPLDFLFES